MENIAPDSIRRASAPWTKLSANFPRPSRGQVDKMCIDHDALFLCSVPVGRAYIPQSILLDSGQETIAFSLRGCLREAVSGKNPDMKGHKVTHTR
jgi:hypothetical protein